MTTKTNTRTETIRYALETCYKALDPDNPLRFSSTEERFKAQEKAREGLLLALEELEKDRA